MTLRKTFTFNGHNSAEYGLFITGAAVHDGAAYDYEFIEIPGRNGDLILDNGRFHNLEVRYPAFVVDPAKMPAIRAWLLGARGYHQLTDDYNPTEYRMACFAYSLQADPFALSAVNFDLVFNCKPQRWQYETGTPTRYIVLDSYQAGAKWQAAGIFNTGGRVYDLSTTDPSAAFADLLSAGNFYDVVKTRDELTIGSDSKGAFIDLTANGLVTTDGTGVALRMTNSGSDFLFEFDSGAGVYYASNAYTLTNQTPYTAAPLLEFIVTNGEWVNAGLHAEVNGIHVTAAPAEEFTGVLYVDSEIADSYYIETDGTKVNANSVVTLTKDGTPTTDFPKLEPGENAVSFYRVTANPSNSYGGYVQIRPRWYTI